MKNPNLIRYLLFTLLMTTAATFPLLAQPTAGQLEKQAHETYRKAYEAEDHQEQADLFEKAAEQYDAAAAAYRKENNENKAREMEGWARAARSNAAIRQPGDLHFTGPGFKQLPLSKAGSSLELGLVTDFPLNRPVDRDYFPVSTFDQIRRALYTDERTFEQLLETFGGEFFPGDFSGEPDFSQPEWRPGPGYGLTAGWEFLPTVGLQLTILHNRSSVDATFPITVIDFAGDTYTKEGSISTDWQEWQLTGGGQWFITKGKIRPYLDGGVVWSHVVGLATTATIGEQLLVIAGEEKLRRTSGYAAAGLELQPVSCLSISSKLVWTGGWRDSPAGHTSTLSGQASLCWRFRHP